MSIYEKRESSGMWLKKNEDIKDGDFVEIASEGETRPSKNSQYKDQEVFLVKTKSGKQGNVSFNPDTINNLIDAFGKDSINWIGKEVKIKAIMQKIGGEFKNVFYFLHPETILEKGKFVLPENLRKIDDTEIPVIEINPEALAEKQQKKDAGLDEEEVK